MINTENLFLNFPQAYWKKIIEDKHLDNMKAYKDGSFRLIKGENSILIDLELFNQWVKDENIKVPDHRHLVRLVDYSIDQLRAIDVQKSPLEN